MTKGSVRWCVVCTSGLLEVLGPRRGVAVGLLRRCRRSSSSRCGLGCGDECEVRCEHTCVGTTRWERRSLPGFFLAHAGELVAGAAAAAVGPFFSSALAGSGAAAAVDFLRFLAHAGVLLAAAAGAAAAAGVVVSLGFSSTGTGSAEGDTKAWVVPA